MIPTRPSEKAQASLFQAEMSLEWKGADFPPPPILNAFMTSDCYKQRSAVQILINTEMAEIRLPGMSRVGEVGGESLLSG